MAAAPELDIGILYLDSPWFNVMILYLLIIKSSARSTGRRTKLQGILMKPITTLLSLCIALLIAQPIAADTNDALAPKSKAADALTEQLHTVTVSTTSLEESLLFYRDGMGMSVEGPLPLDTDTLPIPFCGCLIKILSISPLRL